MNGAWSRWSHWGKCSKVCGGGVQVKSRTCTNPKPKFGGKPCAGRSVKKKKCNTNACPGKTSRETKHLLQSFRVDEKM